MKNDVPLLSLKSVFIYADAITRKNNSYDHIQTIRSIKN